jgi:hypothetical protein
MGEREGPRIQGFEDSSERQKAETKRQKLRNAREQAGKRAGLEACTQQDTGSTSQLAEGEVGRPQII